MAALVGKRRGGRSSGSQPNGRAQGPARGSARALRARWTRPADDAGTGPRRSSGGRQATPAGIPAEQAGGHVLSFHADLAEDSGGFVAADAQGAGLDQALRYLVRASSLSISCDEPTRI